METDISELGGGGTHVVRTPRRGKYAMSVRAIDHKCADLQVLIVYMMITPTTDFVLLTSSAMEMTTGRISSSTSGNRSYF
jgi:hypothetical protein